MISGTKVFTNAYGGKGENRDSIPTIDIGEVDFLPSNIPIVKIAVG